MSEISEALEQLKARAGTYQLYTDYYRGKHELRFATEKFWNTFGHLFSALADNLCPAVVDSVADRLQVTGFGTETGGETEAEAAWDLWEANRMDLRAGQVHKEALKCGDGYVIVWPDPDSGKPTFYPQPAALCTVGYDEESPGKILWGAKCWKTRKKEVRLNVYYPDRIEKWVSRNNNGQLPTNEGGFVPWDEPVVDNPWGAVPLFHFANNAEIGGAGQSELRDVKPLQDALNKSLCDMLVAMEYVAFRQRWAVGLEADIDETTGEPKIPFKPGIDRLWGVASPDVKFGEFQAAELPQFIEVSDGFRIEIARVSGTPLHYISLITDPPSGEALKTLEARFVKKVKDRQTAFGNVWEDAAALALRMAGGSEGVQLAAEWEDAAPVSERELAETLVMKKTLGVSEEKILEELGYGEADVAAMVAQNAQRAKDMAEMALARFDRGE